MLELVLKLYEHQSWADLAHWQAVAASPGPARDPDLRGRQYHIHVVQRAFFQAWQGQEIAVPGQDELDKPGALYTFARDYHLTIPGFLDGLTDERLKETISLPWRQRPAAEPTLEETLLQVAMHSQYHRGQNAARLRALGGEPPMTDFIAWIWHGRPHAEWGPAPLVD